MSNLKELLSKAKAALILDQPFFASILLGIPLIEDNNVKTMVTNGEYIKYNSEWTSKLSLNEIIFVLAHETMHCVFQHMHRRGNKTPKRYNKAGDYIINDLLTKERVGTMPQNGLLDAHLVKAGENTTEGVYKLLPEEKDTPDAGEKDGSLDSVEDAGKGEAEIKQKELEMKVKTIQAKNAAKTIGKLSAGIERLVNDLIKSQVDWRNVLRRFLSERAKTDLSYAKPKRRFLAEDIYLPSLIGEKLGEIAIAVDCSGSIDDTVLKLFASEIKCILEDVKPSKIKVLYFDSVVTRIEEFTDSDSFKINPSGGGGTAFSPVFNKLESEENLTACVFLTDLECNDFGDAPNYPVLWACTQKGMKAPFGEIIELKSGL